MGARTGYAGGAGTGQRAYAAPVPVPMPAAAGYGQQQGYAGTPSCNCSLFHTQSIAGACKLRWGCVGTSYLGTRHYALCDRAEVADVMLVNVLMAMRCSAACSAIWGGPALPAGAGPSTRLCRPAARVRRQLHAAGRAAGRVSQLHSQAGPLCWLGPAAADQDAPRPSPIPPHSPPRPRTAQQLWQQPLCSLLAEGAQVAVDWCK